MDYTSKSLYNNNISYKHTKQPKLLTMNRQLESNMITKRFYLDFIEDKTTPNLVKKFMSKLHLDDYIDCYFCSYDSNLTTDRPTFYNELILLDINLPNGKYFPVIKDFINTSSYYSMYRAGNKADDEDNYKTISNKELLDMVPTNISGIIKNLLDEEEELYTEYIIPAHKKPNTN